MVEAHAVLQVADGVLHLGVAAVVGFQFQGVAFSIGDEAVVSVGVEEGHLGAGRGFDPADDETHRADSGFYTHAVVAACRKHRVHFSITVRQSQSLRDLIEAIPEGDWTPIPYWMEGAADVAETAYTLFQNEPDAAPVRLIVRRVKPTLGSQLALFHAYSYHGFITDREGDTLELEADHRRHAEVENAIRDLKYGVGLNHLPSGRFPANAAWLAVQVMAHNLARWTERIALGQQAATTKTLRQRFFSLAGRITRKARGITLRLPQGWPWQDQVNCALVKLRALPLPA